ncbi:MAG: hypothetical protein K2Y27_08005 [Xanthobacteraceae bacterium]|nr:hypothetical protein [Xanthobacteraceae bacterium]
MTVIAQQRSDSVSIPKINCPQCRAQMVLSMIAPEGPDNLHRMFFECVCGFEYRLSDRANQGR